MADWTLRLLIAVAFYILIGASALCVALLINGIWPIIFVMPVLLALWAVVIPQAINDWNH